MKIEKPKFLVGWTTNSSRRRFDDWFANEVEPINKMLSEAIGMSGCADVGDSYLYFDSVASESDTKPRSHHTHTALLINPQPIKKETAEDVLRAIVHHTVIDHRGGVNVGTNPDFNKCIERARILLSNNP